MDEELESYLTKLLLIKKGTSVHELEFAKSILEYYGFEVTEFESGYTDSGEFDSGGSFSLSVSRPKFSPD